MHNRYLAAGAIFGGLAVILGAFGAHGLEKLTTDEKILHSFQTGVQYQMYHALALVGVAALFEKVTLRMAKWACICFIAGIFLFSGSLYLISFLKIQGYEVGIVGPLTPLGGLFFIAGWLFLLAGAVKKNG